MRLPRITLVAVGFCTPYLEGCGGAVSGDPRPEAVVLSGSDSDPVSTVYACFDGREPLKLGTTGENAMTAYALSPDRRYIALDTGKGGVDVMATSDAAVRRLRDGATAQGMRWSNDEKRLAYFADGKPALADGDGSHPSVIDLSLPLPTGDYGFQDAEWSPDGSMVAFVTRGMAVLVDASSGDARLFSDRAIVEYGTPWSIAFSPDGTNVAILQVDGIEARTVLLTQTDTLESHQVTGINHYAFLGWSIDGRWLSVADTGFRLWLIPSSSGPTVELGGQGHLSPVAPEVAFLSQTDQSLHVRSLDGSDDRIVAAPAQGIAQWSPNGSAIAYGLPDASTVVASANDGKVLVRSSKWIDFGPDGWTVRTDGEHTLTLQRLGSGTRAATTFDVSSFTAAGDQFEWLPGDRFAFVSDRALHVARLDGSEDHVACRDVRGIVLPQGPRL